MIQLQGSTSVMKFETRVLSSSSSSPRKILHAEGKEKRREEISMPYPSPRLNKLGWVAINQQRISCGGKACHAQLHKERGKSQISHNLLNKAPLNSIIRFLVVNLHHTRRLSVILVVYLNDILTIQSIVKNRSSCPKSSPVKRDDVK